MPRPPGMNPGGNSRAPWGHDNNPDSNECLRHQPSLTRALHSSSIGGVSTVDDLSERLEFLQGTLEVLVLRSLQPGPNHAYGIAQFLRQQSEEEFAVDNGSLYPALQRL